MKMTKLEQRLTEAFPKAFKFIQIDVDNSHLLVDISKLPNSYNLDFKHNMKEDRLVWERQIDRRGHIFHMMYMIDGTVEGTQEAIDFSINRMNQDFEKIIVKQG